MEAGNLELIAKLTGAPLKVLQGSAGTSSEATASSRISDSYEATEAWDGVVDGAGGTTNAWVSNNSNPPASDGSLWWQLDFSAAKDLRAFRFQANEATGYDQWPDDVTILGKTSAQSWGEATELYDGALSGADSLTPGDWSAWYDFAAWGDFDAYRIEINSAYIYAGVFDRVSIQEFEFKEYQTPKEIVRVTNATLEGALALSGLPRTPVKLNLALSCDSVQATTIPRTRQFYRVWITGTGDGLSNLEVEASSVQCRARSGDPTFISIAIPAFSCATDIAARSNGQVVVEIVYKTAAGVVLQAEEIARADITDIQTHEGGKSRSIIVEALSTTTHTPKTVPLSGVVYRRLAYGRTSLRFAKPDPYLRPGDTVTTDLGDSVEADAITYTLSPRNMTMEIAEA